MRLTKNRAKEVLLYLLNRNIDRSIMSKIVDIDIDDDRLTYKEDCDSCYFNVYDNDFCCFNEQKQKCIVTKNLKSLPAFVRMLFKHVNDGYAIHSRLYKDDELFIHAYESLEQVMIEMVLNRLEEK